MPSYVSDFKQTHFVVHELILPYCTTCTPIDGDTSYYTPLLCEEDSDEEYSLYFTKNTAPLVDPSSLFDTDAISGKSILNSKIWRVVASENVTATELKAGEGLASRGSIKITMNDVEGDPGPITFTEEGTLFGKLEARNILEGKKLKSHFFTIDDDGTITKVNEYTHYVTNNYLSAGKYTLQAKDALKDLEAFSESFPALGTVSLTADITETATTLYIDTSDGVEVDNVYLIDDELFYVTAVDGLTVTVETRGTGLTYNGNVVYKTNTSEHSEGATLQPCYTMLDTPVVDFVNDVFTASGLSDFADYTQWDEEVSQWDGDAILRGVITEPTDTDTLLNKVLSAFMIDMWLDQETQLAVMSTNTPWKESTLTFEEGNDVQDYMVSTSADTRFSRAWIPAVKEYQAENDDLTNYSRIIASTNIDSESSDNYGSESQKEFDAIQWITSDGALRKTARFIQRYQAPPRSVTFNIEERKAVDLVEGAVISVTSRDKQSPSGEILSEPDRLQVLKIQPELNKVGRRYKVKGLAYIPLYASDPTEEQYQVIPADYYGLNLATYVSAPAGTDLNYTFILDGSLNSGLFGSVADGSVWTAGIRAGEWSSGSRLRIILINGAKLSAKGGDAVGSIGGDLDGDDGGTVYESNGIETEIYLNWTDVDGYTPDGEMLAPGGAGGSIQIVQEPISPNPTILSGGGGSGIPAGEAVEDYEGYNGTYNTGGASFEYYREDDPNEGYTGAGGSSADGDDATVVGTGSEGLGGEAGYLVTGGNVTIYNNDATKLETGQSVAGVDYTLVES